MNYKLVNHEIGWYRCFKGSEDEAIKEIERLSQFHASRFILCDDRGKVIGRTYIPEPTYVFLRG